MELIVNLSLPKALKVISVGMFYSAERASSDLQLKSNWTQSLGILKHWSAHVMGLDFSAFSFSCIYKTQLAWRQLMCLVTGSASKFNTWCYSMPWDIAAIITSPCLHGPRMLGGGGNLPGSRNARSDIAEVQRGVKQN